MPEIRGRLTPQTATTPPSYVNGSKQNQPTPAQGHQTASYGALPSQIPVSSQATQTSALVPGSNTIMGPNGGSSRQTINPIDGRSSNVKRTGSEENVDVTS